MKKNHTLLLTLALFASSVLLAGCDNSEHERKVKCTKLSNESSDAFLGKGTRKQSEIMADWEALSCHRTDIIQG